MEEPAEPQSIQARIAALKLNQVGRGPVTATPPPPGSVPPTKTVRRASANVPLGNSSNNGIGNEHDGPSRSNVLPPPTTILRDRQVSSPSLGPGSTPKLPPRRPTNPSPALPPRRPSDQLSRRDSQESLSSVVSSVSALSNGTTRATSTTRSRQPSSDGTRPMAPVYDPSTLPPLPPKRAEQEKMKKEMARIPLKGTKSSPSVPKADVLPPPILHASTLPTIPQRPPARGRATELLPPSQPARKLAPREPPPMPARSRPSPNSDEHTHGGYLNGNTNGYANGHINGRTSSSNPPPIPLSSRPDLSKILATKPKMPSIPLGTRPTQTSSGVCLKCRDFSAPDAHAACYPRQNVPSIDWLAHELTTPFPFPTDKARAIFTWLHHNVEYDVYSFFNNCVRGQTPADTLSTGLAVCEGYAGLFVTLALKAGLEAVKISGHGKGYGFSALQPGDPIPPQKASHAWNAVKIDNGEWKLIDACWGAGSVAGKDKPYQKHFKPERFTQDNDEFGLDHFPMNGDYFYRNDGRPRISWEEYIRGDPGGEYLTIYSNNCENEGFNKRSFTPRYKKIPFSPSAHPGSTIHFSFKRSCPHWTPEKHGLGKPYTYVLCHAGEWTPFDTNGREWWVDIPVSKIGKRGDNIQLYLVKTVGDNDGRGMTKERYLQAKGRMGMGFGGVAGWDVV
ncbi:MAG: hypothetical protein MMC33_004790 [Icmadophila ericetorum]|nr:hypothetical protein [Icmadophila ericetorum]